MAGKVCAHIHTLTHWWRRRKQRREWNGQMGLLNFHEQLLLFIFTSKGTRTRCKVWTSMAYLYSYYYSHYLLLLLFPYCTFFSLYIDFIWASSLIYILDPCHLVETWYNGRLTEGQNPHPRKGLWAKSRQLYSKTHRWCLQTENLSILADFLNLLSCHCIPICCQWNKLH
jgi:hypothetical protein